MSTLDITYNIGNIYLHRIGLARCKRMSVERLVYPILKRKFVSKGWMYYRIENRLEGGIPDILLFKDGMTLFMEVKYLHKEAQKDTGNVNIVKSFTWQRGQLAFLLKAAAHNIPYILCIYYNTYLHFYIASKKEMYPDAILAFSNITECL